MHQFHVYRMMHLRRLLLQHCAFLDMITCPYVFNEEAAQFIFNHTQGISGFFGASSMERLPTEVGIENQARSFKTLKL